MSPFTYWRGGARTPRPVSPVRHHPGASRLHSTRDAIGRALCARRWTDSCFGERRAQSARPMSRRKPAPSNARRYRAGALHPPWHGSLRRREAGAERPPYAADDVREAGAERGGRRAPALYQTKTPHSREVSPIAPPGIRRGQRPRPIWTLLIQRGYPAPWRYDTTQHLCGVLGIGVVSLGRGNGTKWGETHNRTHNTTASGFSEPGAG